MTAGLDTSVVVRLLVGEPEAQAMAAKRWLEHTAEAGGGPVYISDLVAGESYFALRHHYAVPHEEALHALRAFVADERIRADSAAEAVLRDPQSAAVRPGFMDRLIHRGYRLEGLALVTFDKDAGLLPGATLLA